MTSEALRSILFVPATRPERIAKALASEADAVIVDLEDAVAESDKESAREALDAFLMHHPQTRLMVRINAPGTLYYEADLALGARQAAITHLVIPKAESCQALEKAAASGKPIWPLIETARGLLALSSLVHVAGVERLNFGALDMSTELGLIPDTPGARQILDQARYQLVIHSYAAGLAPPIESPHQAIDDTDAVAQAATRAREMGFAGMLCIHPSQLPTVNQTFLPNEAEVAWAKEIVKSANLQGGAFSVNGQMVDAPVVARAQRILAKHDTGT
ncbi:citrate lyase subunit beta/citryl-CoA lyase/(S)-citramalyl-CoA lyase [Chromohalobacter marismortui]|uniref:Citrate lyase subunit beta/citryl-CoA lyase/(S)-citramalyl-CoA lyase n=1 Tax=Chromohalobacter marismortui TaxID=42055 RepID=A0A4R7NDE1_9GAMM|nr:MULTISPECIES: CoA ester lyase [Chromohalobacter]MCI0592985.1 CoA ester lyase [Chromohalobacter sp.]TDU18061.1 citrate lyase subunit beta/citryl-CoA lyase/(S)-citramalyl-CoA lyase [Chromohalobacter marismortui]